MQSTDQISVLLVDDEDDFRRTVTAGLAANGFRVLSAASGKEALYVTSQLDRVDVVVMDAVLPDSWGPSVSHELSWIRPALKFIYISGRSRDDEIFRASQTEDVPFLEKPFSISELVETIERVVDDRADAAG